MGVTDSKKLDAKPSAPWLRLPADPAAQAKTANEPLEQNDSQTQIGIATVIIDDLRTTPPKRKHTPEPAHDFKIPVSETSPKTDAPALSINVPAQQAEPVAQREPSSRREAQDAQVMTPAGRPATSPSTSHPPSVIPFRKSRKAAGRPREARIKAFLYGNTGTGKTLNALQFPRPLVIDLEGGTDIYEDSFSFTVLDHEAFGGPTENDWARLNAAVDYLLAYPEITAEFETLVIDPITVAWEACIDMWTERFLQRRKKGRGGHQHEFYDLQPGDWRHLKGSLKGLFRRLARLPLHIVATAREKPRYAEGELMRRVGDTFDGERNLPYYFDLALRLEKGSGERFRATVEKSRNWLLSRQHYIYEGATGLYQIIAQRMAGGPEPEDAAPTIKHDNETDDEIDDVQDGTNGIGINIRI